MARNAMGLVALCLTLLLTACGFHLRGMGEGVARVFPFTSIYIDSNAAVAGSIRDALKSYPQIQVLTAARKAQAVLRIISDDATSEISGIDRSGQANEYRLNYKLVARLFINGEQVGSDIELSQSRTMTYTDSAVLGKDQEEQVIWADMRNSVAQIMIYKLSSNQMLRAAAEAAASAPMSIVPEHVSPQP